MIMNVRFQFNLPGFHIPSFSFPCIRILFITVGNCDKPPTNDENNQPSSSSSTPASSPTSPSTSSPSTTQSSSSCTETQTTSDCQVTCSLSSMPDGGTTTDCYTTICSITRAPCTITATTSTTVLSTTSVLQCPRGSSDDEIACLPDHLDCLILDDPAGNIKINMPVSTLGQVPNRCSLSMDTALTSITWPVYPGAGTILKDDLVAAGVTTFTATSPTPYLQGTKTSLLRWLSATTDTANCAPSIVSIPALQFQAALDAAPSSDRSQCMPSLDHAFEKNWLMSFLDGIINTAAQPLSSVGSVVAQINCDDLHDFFFGVHRTRNTLGELFNAMPGGEDNFLSLAGMSRQLNNAAKVRWPDSVKIAF